MSDSCFSGHVEKISHSRRQRVEYSHSKEPHLANMDEQLNNFIPLSIIRNVGHMNISKYITKFKRDVPGTADYDCLNFLICQTWLLKKNCTQVERRRSNISKSQKNTMHSQINYSTFLRKVYADISYLLLQIWCFWSRFCSFSFLLRVLSTFFPFCHLHPTYPIGGFFYRATDIKVANFHYWPSSFKKTSKRRTITTIAI